MEGLNRFVINDNPSGWGPPDDFKLPGYILQLAEGVEKPLKVVDFNLTAKAEEEDDFSVVESKAQYKTKLGNKKGIHSLKAAWAKTKQQPQQKLVVTQQPQQAAQQQRPGMKRVFRDSSVTIRGEWELQAELSKVYFEKLNYNPGIPEEFLTVSSVHEFNKVFDRINVKKPIDLDPERYVIPGTTQPLVFSNTSTSQDALMQRFIENNQAEVFITDAIASTLMTITRSVFPWDIQVTKQGNKLIFDKTDESVLEQYSVNENAGENMPEEEEAEGGINSQRELTKEAYAINKAFLLSTLKNNKLKLGEEHPHYVETPNHAPIAYKYRRWQMGENTRIIIRTEIDSFQETEGGNQMLKVRALNEYDPKITGQYKHLIETRKGQLISTEFKNNSCKISRWAVQAMLSSVDQVKLGFVTRANFRSNKKHQVVGLHKFATKDLLTHLNLSYTNGWGILRAMIDLCNQQPADGKYFFVRDPNKMVLRLYSVKQEATEVSGQDI